MWKKKPMDWKVSEKKACREILPGDLNSAKKHELDFLTEFCLVDSKYKFSTDTKNQRTDDEFTNKICSVNQAKHGLGKVLLDSKVPKLCVKEQKSQKFSAEESMMAKSIWENFSAKRYIQSVQLAYEVLHFHRNLVSAPAAPSAYVKWPHFKKFRLKNIVGRKISANFSA